MHTQDTKMRSIKPAVAALFIGLAAVLGGAGFAEPATAAAVLQHNENVITLEANRGVLVKLDAKAENIFIANPEIADVQVKSPKLFYVFGLLPGETSVYAVDERDNVIYSATVLITQNISRLQDTIDKMLPTASIKIESINNLIVLSGNALSPDDADTAQTLVRQSIGPEQQIVNRIQISTPTQVNLRVKVAEMSRDTLKTLGFNWDVGFSGASNAFTFGQGREIFGFFENPVTEQFEERFIRPIDTPSLGFENVGGQHSVGAMIDALESEGYVTILAEPNLTALSGETAGFLAGGEFPIPIPNAGFGTISIEFKEFGVGLNFRPTVLSENKINLQISQEVSQLSEAGAINVNQVSVPAITTRRASTTVELASGQSFAIAGLLQSSVNQTSEKLPWLGDIPILGTLFRSERFQRQETELVILVTPYIVRPVGQNRLVAPTDINHMPDDTGRYIKGIGQWGSPGDDRDLAGTGGLRADK